MNPKILLLLLAAIAAKAQAEAQAKPETPRDCPGCTFNRALDGLLDARKAVKIADAEADAADQVADAAGRKRSETLGALMKAQGEFDAAADAINKAGRAQA